MRKLVVLLIVFVFASCFLSAEVYSQREKLPEQAAAEVPLELAVAESLIAPKKAISAWDKIKITKILEFVLFQVNCGWVDNRRSPAIYLIEYFLNFR